MAKGHGGELFLRNRHSAKGVTLDERKPSDLSLPELFQRVAELQTKNTKLTNEREELKQTIQAVIDGWREKAIELENYDEEDGLVRRKVLRMATANIYKSFADALAIMVKEKFSYNEETSKALWLQEKSDGHDKKA